MVLTYSEVHQYVPENIETFAFIMHDPTDLDQPSPLDYFVFKRNFKIVQFTEKLKPLRIDPSKIKNKLTENIYELLLPS